MASGVHKTVAHSVVLYIFRQVVCLETDRHQPILSSKQRAAHPSEAREMSRRKTREQLSCAVIFVFSGSIDIVEVRGSSPPNPTTYRKLNSLRFFVVLTSWRGPKPKRALWAMQRGAGLPRKRVQQAHAPLHDYFEADRA